MKALTIALSLLGVLLLAGCEQKPADGEQTFSQSLQQQTETPPASSETTTGEAEQPQTPPNDAPTTSAALVPESAQKGPVKMEHNGVGEIKDREPKEGEEVAVLHTNYGRIVVMFFPDKAPNHVKRFKECCTKKIFDGTKFHRVIPGFMIQGGDPNSKDDDRSNDGMGGYGSMLQAEFNDVKHVPGILSAARSGDPNSAQSQFFLMHGVAASLDGAYSAYGKIIEGLDVVNKIVNLPRDRGDNPLPDNPATILHATVEKFPLK